MPARIAIVYYSATGIVHELAKAVGEGAEQAGAEVRIRKVAETVPAEVIATNPGWEAHVAATQDVPVATHDDLVWANGYAFGTPSRFGMEAAQLKAFLDSCGGLWFEGKVANKAATTFTSAMNAHGGNEAAALALWPLFAHWGCVIVPPGYTDPQLFAAGGNPYGTAWASGQANDRPNDAALQAARIQGARLAKAAAAIDGQL